MHYENDIPVKVQKWASAIVAVLAVVGMAVFIWKTWFDKPDPSVDRFFKQGEAESKAYRKLLKKLTEKVDAGETPVAFKIINKQLQVLPTIKPDTDATAEPKQ